MKFLLVTDLFPKFPGGAENHVFRILKELQRRGHEVACVCNDLGSQLISSEEAGFPVMKLPTPNSLGSEWSKINDCIKMYKKWITLTPEQREFAHSVKKKMIDLVIKELGKPDAIITHTYFAFLFHNELKELGVPISTLSYQGQVFPDSDINLFVSKCRMDCKKVREGALYDVPVLYDKAEIDDKDLVLYPICKKEPLPAHVPEFDVGQIKLIGHKDPDTFWKLAKDFPDKKFLVVRGEWDWHDQMIDPIPFNVTVIKACGDIIADFFSKIKVYLHTALVEDFGMAALEAQFLGIPVISRPLYGLVESVGAGGVMCDDYDEIKEACSKLLNRQEYYEQIKENGFKHSEEIHQKTMEQYDKWLMKLQK